MPTAAGFLYLAVGLDRWSRKMAGWSMAHHLRAALMRAVDHADPKSQYTSLAFGGRCQQAGVRPASGSAGDAVCVSFFSTLAGE